MDQSLSSSPTAPRPIRSVLGEISYQDMGITDAHNHVWIEPVSGADKAAPVLDQFDLILAELISYREAGGRSLLDCQPGGCGRNGNQLARLSSESGVNITACTGFHRRKYYPPDFWLFKASENQAVDYFMAEILESLEETNSASIVTRAGFIKIALESSWKDIPLAALDASAEAARQTGSVIEIHTEKGALAEKAVIYFEDRGIKPVQVVLCHMDKRPDIGLHKELCRYGALLEYDTFYRPKYDPELLLWPMINAMIEAGFSNHIALATDMAEAEMYRSIGNGPGLSSLPTEINIRLSKNGIPSDTIRKLLGGNIARRLAGLS